MVRKIGAGHDVGVVLFNLKIRVAVEQYVGECCHFSLAHVATTADMANDVFRFEHIGIEQTELANTGHCQLKRNLAAARSAPGNQYTCIAQKADVKERRYTRKQLVIVHPATLPA